MYNKVTPLPSENPAPAETSEIHSGESASTSAEQSKLTIVGIGASAGGLAALQTFFDNVPSDSGLAFVVVVHLSPDFESHLSDILRPHVHFPIEQVKTTTKLEPNHVYVIPPNANLSAIDTHLRLSELEGSRSKRAPIDQFFRTLASTHDVNSVGVILTGTGSDGALGVKDIKAKGGVVIVQDPVDAEYDGMPVSAIATGLVDLVLPAAKIPEAILRIHRTEPKVPIPAEGEDFPLSEHGILSRIFTLIRTTTDRDFTSYHRPTIMRQLARRMQLNYIEDLQTYLDQLSQQPDEVYALADDLLITITRFFRDPEVFGKLEKDVIPQLFDGREEKDPLRVWSVGCATGEEAYSIGMLLVEEAGRRDSPPQIQIFASDLHRSSVERAREGFYPGDIELDVTPDRLRRFFQKEEGGYRIRKQVRNLAIFVPHNLLANAPFSRLSLICCRNLLMYLDRDVQHAVIELFHYALNPDGILLLSPADSIDNGDLFRVEDKTTGFYRKRNVPPSEARLPVFPLGWSRHAGEHARQNTRMTEPYGYGVLHQRMIELYAPPSVLISPDNKLIHLSENAGRYIVHPGGELTTNLFKLVREELRIELRVLLQTVREKRERAASKPIPVRFNEALHPVVMRAGPVRDPDYEGFALVIFEEREPAETKEPPAGHDAGRAARIRDLENEVELSRARLQAVIAEYEKSQEEIAAANEEMQSANQELRSALEELKISKEEMYSINEDLLTLNQEHRHKVEELGQLSSDLQNLLSATQIATLFLDMDLRIVRFTPKLSDLFNVRTTDRGRPVSDLTHRLGYPELQKDVESVRDQLQIIEREIQDQAGQWYFTRVLPYRSTDRIEGVVITFMDITRLRGGAQNAGPIGS